MSFRQRAKNLRGDRVTVITTAGSATGKLSSVGTDNLVLVVGSGLNRRVFIIRFDEIVALRPFLLLARS